MGWYTGYPKAWLILILPNLQNMSGVQRFLLLDWSILWKSDVKVCTDLVIWSQMHPSLTLEKGLVSSILPGAYILPFLSYSLHMNIPTLRKFISDRGKIRARRITGNCTQHQRDIANAVKNAREIALLPYTSTAR